MVRPSLNPEIQIVATAEELGLAAARQFVYRAREAIVEGNLFTVALSGGSTPKSMYSRLANDPSLNSQLSWHSVHFFWGDERHVPPDHPDSNYGMAYETMLSKLPVPPENVHRIKGEYQSAGRAAYEYDRGLRKFFGLKPGQAPRFDLVLLGMGADGHTASLFPGTKALREQKRLAVANWIQRFNAYRFTMTTPVLNHAAWVIFLVSGEEKAEMLSEVLYGEYQPERYPAQLIRPVNGRLLWLVDNGATRLLRVHPS